MSKLSLKTKVSLADLALPALKATTSQEFMQAIRSGFDGLYDRLLSPGHSRKQTLAALDALFSGDLTNVRQRRVLELCAWPIFDKPALPAVPSQLPEFLWLFCLPFVVTGSGVSKSNPVDLPLDAPRLLSLLTDTNWISDKGVLSTFPTLLTREDLHALGPQHLATSFVRAEAGASASLPVKPLSFDSALSGTSVKTLFLVCAARMPIGERALFSPQAKWDGTALADGVSTSLGTAGVTVSQVQSARPCSMAEALFHCAGAGRLELGVVLDLARLPQQEQGLELRFPIEGVAELVAVSRCGAEQLVAPPFHFVEPKAELQRCLRVLCDQRGIAFKGAFSAAVPQGSMLH